MTKIDLTKYDFSLAGEKVAYAEIAPIKFRQYAGIFGAAARYGNGREMQKEITRLRLARQARLFTAAGKAIPLADKDVPMLPAAAAKALLAQLYAGDAGAGKVIQAGDCIDQPLIYALAEPINFGGGKIIELEFSAKNFGQIEDIFAEPNPLMKAFWLITKCSVPLFKNEGDKTPAMLATPESAADALSIGDGIAITEKVLSVFLGEGGNSAE